MAARFSKLALPTIKETIKKRRILLSKRTNWARRIIWHQNQMARVSLLLAEEIKTKAGKELNRRDLFLASMLHDAIVLEGVLQKNRSYVEEKMRLLKKGLKETKVRNYKAIADGTNAFRLFAGKRPRDPLKLPLITKVILLADFYMVHDRLSPSGALKYHRQKAKLVSCRTKEDVDKVFRAMDKIEEEFARMRINVRSIFKRVNKRQPSRAATLDYLPIPKE